MPRGEDLLGKEKKLLGLSIVSRLVTPLDVFRVICNGGTRDRKCSAEDSYLATVHVIHNITVRRISKWLSKSP
jgi:hypothetical protein